MKRLNPNTGLHFKRGDLREDGLIFMRYKYKRPLNNFGYFQELWLAPETFFNEVKRPTINADLLMTSKIGHIKLIRTSVKHRSKKLNIPFNLTPTYLLSIAPDICPVLEIKLGWCERNKSVKHHSPSLDKIIPKLGYIEGNVQWISHKANSMKHNASFKELHQFADWVKSTIPNE